MKEAFKGMVITSAFGVMLAASFGTDAADWPESSVAFVAHRGGIAPGYPENTIAARGF